ncbi:hypothetical protein [Candidatus Mycolicibacterium alkanivorans]|nr:hypothetical protein [Candidatus Mycolicibacterium alkanivorans]
MAAGADVDRLAHALLDAVEEGVEREQGLLATFRRTAVDIVR